MSDASVSHVVHAETPDPRRWFALVVIGIAQLMVILDASIVNIALPHASLPKALGDWPSRRRITSGRSPPTP